MPFQSETAFAKILFCLFAFLILTVGKGQRPEQEKLFARLAQSGNQSTSSIP